MSTTDELILGVSSILALLSLIPGLWIAGWTVRRVSPWLAPPAGLPERLGRVPLLALWLGLGALFASPVIDIVDLICSFFLVLAPSSLVPTFSLLWGEAPYRLHIILTSLLLLASYAFGIWAGSALVRTLRGRLFPHHPPGNIEKAFYLLALGSLINSFTKFLVGGILHVQIPSLYGAFYDIGLYGPAGYAAGWTIAIAALMLVVLALTFRLQGFQENEPE